MNLHQLNYFRTLVEFKQFTVAAEELHISQPTLSNSIKSMEKELGCRLVSRSGHSIELTQYGSMFYSTACSTLTVFEQGVKALHDKVRSDAGYVSLACIPTFIGTVLPHVIKAFQEEHDGMPKFVLSNQVSLPILEGLVTDKYKMGICSYDPGYEDLTFVPLYTERFVVAVPQDHPLAAFETINPYMLTSYDLITYSPDIPIGREIRESLEDVWPELHISDTLDGEITIAGEALANNAVAVVADTILLDSFELCKIPLNVSKDTHKVYIVYDPRRQLSHWYRDFSTYLREHLTECEQLSPRQFKAGNHPADPAKEAGPPPSP